MSITSIFAPFSRRVAARPDFGSSKEAPFSARNAFYTQITSATPPKFSKPIQLPDRATPPNGQGNKDLASDLYPARLAPHLHHRRRKTGHFRVKHKMSGDVTAGYIISDVERLREPMQKISTQMLKTIGIKPIASIIPLRNWQNGTST